MRGLLIVLLLLPASTRSQHRPVIGVALDTRLDSLQSFDGYAGIVESVSRCLSPRNVSEEGFQQQLQGWKKRNIRIMACNLFLPPDLKVVGDQINKAELIAYATIVFRRCQLAGIPIIVWGSGGSRTVPTGYDRAKARQQFVLVARELATLASTYDVTLALENLNRTEVNFINTLQEANSIAEEVNHPNFRLCADIYHMQREAESPEVIEAAGDLIVHCDIAEKVGRKPPGTYATDFRPYFRALRNIDYRGAIVLECEWSSYEREAPMALRWLSNQWEEVFSSK